MNKSIDKKVQNSHEDRSACKNSELNFGIADGYTSFLIDKTEEAGHSVLTDRNRSREPSQEFGLTADYSTASFESKQFIQEHNSENNTQDTPRVIGVNGTNTNGPTSVEMLWPMNHTSLEQYQNNVGLAFLVSNVETRLSSVESQVSSLTDHMIAMLSPKRYVRTKYSSGMPRFAKIFKENPDFAYFQYLKSTYRISGLYKPRGQLYHLGGHITLSGYLSPYKGIFDPNHLDINRNTPLSTIDFEVLDYLLSDDYREALTGVFLSLRYEEVPVGDRFFVQITVCRQQNDDDSEMDCTYAVIVGERASLVRHKDRYGTIRLKKGERSLRREIELVAEQKGVSDIVVESTWPNGEIFVNRISIKIVEAKGDVEGSQRLTQDMYIHSFPVMSDIMKS